MIESQKGGIKSDKIFENFLTLQGSFLWGPGPNMLSGFQPSSSDSCLFHTFSQNFNQTHTLYPLFFLFLHSLPRAHLCQTNFILGHYIHWTPISANQVGSVDELSWSLQTPKI